MFWHRPIQQDNAVLVIGCAVINDRYQEFAGRGHSLAHAKSKALILMWRESRRQKQLPEDHADTETVRRFSARIP